MKKFILGFGLMVGTLAVCAQSRPVLPAQGPVDVCVGTLTGLNDGGTPALNNLSMGSGNGNCGGAVTDGGFPLMPGERISIQCTAATYITAGNGNTTAANTLNSVKVAADSLFDKQLSGSQNAIGMLPVGSGNSSTCTVNKAY